MALPDEDRIPYRHAYGNYTHLSRDGRYWFEWTPFTPAVRAWENAERYLRSALGHLRDARQLPGFALNGLAGDHERMMATIEVIAQDLERSVTEAGLIARALDVANRDYAASADASLGEYQALMAAIDATTTNRRGVRAGEDRTESGAEADRDKQLGPLDPPPADTGPAVTDPVTDPGPPEYPGP